MFAHLVITFSPDTAQPHSPSRKCFQNIRFVPNMREFWVSCFEIWWMHSHMPVPTTDFAKLARALKFVAPLVYPPSSTAETGQSRWFHQNFPMEEIYLNPVQSYSLAQAPIRKRRPFQWEPFQHRRVHRQPHLSKPGTRGRLEVVTSKEVAVTAVFSKFEF